MIWINFLRHYELFRVIQDFPGRLESRCVWMTIQMISRLSSCSYSEGAGKSFDVTLRIMGCSLNMSFMISWMSTPQNYQYLPACLRSQAIDSNVAAALPCTGDLPAILTGMIVHSMLPIPRLHTSSYHVYTPG